jgi:hypothetical protein
MIRNFLASSFSPRGDTILVKQEYRSEPGVGAHGRSHTKALFRKIEFCNDNDDEDSKVPEDHGTDTGIRETAKE